MRPYSPTKRCPGVVLGVVVGLLVTLAAAAAGPEADGWVVLIGRDGPHGWRDVPAGWQEVGGVHMSAGDLRSLAGRAGRGVLFNGKTGRAADLVTKADFGDVEAHVEFLVPKGSNTGVKFQGVYEVQIDDSYGIRRPDARHSGGIYPRAELLPKYRYLDDGYPPRVNAARPPGEWQTLDVVFHAPRFDAGGKKVGNAAFVKVALNGTVVQQDLEVPSPTGHNWSRPEHPRGPLLLQGDHGPVAFRNVRVRPTTDGTR